MQFNKNYNYHFIGRSTHNRFKPIYNSNILSINEIFHPNLSNIILQYLRYNPYIDELLFETSQIYLLTQTYIYYRRRYYSIILINKYWEYASPKIRSIRSRVVSELATILTTYYDENKKFKSYDSQNYRWIIS